MTDGVDPAGWRDLNHAWWEERAPLHATHGFYDLESGMGLGLRDFEWELIGDVEGLDIVHPQCHIGTDTISLARAGARTVGIDFSANAVDAARRIAASADLESRTEWVVSDVYDAMAAVEGRTFDVVYTGFGALCWLPDLPRWATVMDGLCRSGGTLMLSEFHPLQDVLGDDEPVLERDYFQAGGEVFEEPGSYASDGAGTEANTIVDFIHSISEVLTVVLDQGFVIRSFREYDFTLFERWPWLEEDEGGIFRLPPGVPKIPLMYSLVADKPA
jgi:SAM-dependent methyltransferase